MRVRAGERPADFFSLGKTGEEARELCAAAIHIRT